MSRNHLLPGLLFLMASCNNPDITHKMSEQNLYSTTQEDQEMNRAIVTARQNFPRFDSAFESKRYDPNIFTIKVRFADPNGNEYIWLTEIAKVGNHYSGVVSDTPRLTQLVRLGDMYQIPEKDIVDWMYGKDSVVHGGYTLRLILSRLSAEDRAKAQADYPYKIED